jgi:hypothetical protein
MAVKKPTSKTGSGDKPSSPTRQRAVVSEKQPRTLGKRDQQLQVVSKNLKVAKERFKDVETVTVGEIGLTVTTKLPHSAIDAVIEATQLVAEGKHARVVVIEDEISTSDAARLLGISRPHLIGLLDAGQLPYRKTSDRPSAHRYLKTDDVLDYRRRRSEAESAMEEYGAISDQLGV